MDSPIAAIKVSFPSQANVQSYSLNPIPASGAIFNPAALRVYEMTYTPAGAAELRIPIISTKRFQALTGQYVARLANYSNYPDAACQIFGKRQLDLFPGTAVFKDAISLTVCPDPMSTATAPVSAGGAYTSNVPCSNGGIMVNDTDVPIFYPQYHPALAYYAAAKICESAGATQQWQQFMQSFTNYVQSALSDYASVGEGDAEVTVVDGGGF